MKTINLKSKADYQDIRIVVLTEKQLSDLIRAAVGAALQDPSFMKTVDGGEIYNRLSRKATAQALGVSLASLDRISRTQPDLLPKQRDDHGKPFFYRGDVNKYLQYRGDFA